MENKGLKNCIIVCSGMSAKSFRAPPDCIVIAVNGVIDWINRADYFFTLDPSKENIKRLENKKPNTKYVVAYNESLKVPGIEYLQRVETPQTKLNNKFIGVLGLQKDSYKISTGNSGYGALNFAYHLGVEKVLFVGLDGTAKRVEGGNSRNLSHLSLLFNSALKDLKIKNIQVKNGSPQSLVTSFEKCTIEQGLRWLK